MRIHGAFIGTRNTSPGRGDVEVEVEVEVEGEVEGEVGKWRAEISRWSAGTHP